MLTRPRHSLCLTPVRRREAVRWNKLKFAEISKEGVGLLIQLPNAGCNGKELQRRQKKQMTCKGSFYHVRDLKCSW